MPDLDRWEEYAREQREAGGAYDPTYDADVDVAEPSDVKLGSVDLDGYVLRSWSSWGDLVEVVEYRTWRDDDGTLTRYVVAVVEGGRQMEFDLDTLYARNWRLVAL